MWRWKAAAPLTPLKKARDDDGVEGVRPIAVGETLRRLTAKMLLRRFNDHPRHVMAPRQLGVSTPNGQGIIIHKLRHMVRKHGADADYTIVKIDFENALNLVNR